MKEQENPYKVPEGYFEDVKARILARTIHSGVQPQSKEQQQDDSAVIVDFVPREKKKMTTNWRSLAGLAASFVLLVGLSSTAFMFINSTVNEEQEDTATTLLTAEITAEEAVLWNADVLDYYDMVESDDAELFAQEAAEYVEDWGLGGLGGLNLDILEDNESLVE